MRWDIDSVPDVSDHTIVRDGETSDFYFECDDLWNKRTESAGRVVMIHAGQSFTSDLWEDGSDPWVIVLRLSDGKLIERVTGAENRWRMWRDRRMAYRHARRRYNKRSLRRYWFRIHYSATNWYRSARWVRRARVEAAVLWHGALFTLGGALVLLVLGAIGAGARSIGLWP